MVEKTEKARIDLSDTEQVLIFDDNMNVIEELLHLKSLKGQSRGMDLFVPIFEAVDDMKLPWGIVSGAPAMAGEQSELTTLSAIKLAKKQVTLLNFTV